MAGPGPNEPIRDVRAEVRTRRHEEGAGFGVPDKGPKKMGVREEKGG